MLNNLDVNDKILYGKGFFSGDYNQELYIKRSIDDGINNEKYYISAYSNINGELVQQGYLYFYLDKKNGISDFIGVGVDPKYRNLNIASFLVASWIDLCLNNGYDFLGANKKQRKPFLLYLLKTYGFEVFDKSLYQSRNDVITICRSIDVKNNDKILLFKDKKIEKTFKETNIFKTDNYKIVDSKENIITLDDVIIPFQNMSKSNVYYELIDRFICEDKVNKVINRHKR